MGCGACKTSHLGKNTLQNRRFLESNNADSGEAVFGSDTEEVLSPRTGWLLLLSAGAISATGRASGSCSCWGVYHSHNTP